MALVSLLRASGQLVWVPATVVSVCWSRMSRATRLGEGWVLASK